MKKRKNIFKPLLGIRAKNTHVGSIGSSNNERWIFSILSADKDAPNIEEEKPLRRFYGFFIVIVTAFVIIFGRTFYLQIVNGQESLRLAQENRFRIQTIRAPRGILYDRNKTPLVKNIANYEITVIPTDLPPTASEREPIYENLASIIKITPETIRQVAESKEESVSDDEKLKYTQPILIEKSVSRDISLIFESKQALLRGFYVGINPIREYLDGGLLSHALGYVGRISEEELASNKDYMMTDYIGKTGIERSYESVLKGTDGKERIEVDSKGEIIRTYGQEDPILGDNIMLSIDLGLQQKLSEELQKQMIAGKTKKATAVAINPQNGEVLAYVSLPGYDNNLFAKGINDINYNKLLNDDTMPLLDRISQGEYPSGSTIKPFLAAAALEEGNVTTKTTINSTGGITIGQWSFPDWKGGGHGTTDVFKAIAESVNTFFYAIGGGYNNIKGMGPDVMKGYLERFGFGNYVETDIGSSAKGHIPTPDWKEEVKGEAWYLGDTYNMSIGQGDLLVTPLQMVNALSAIANGGTLYKLHFLKSVLNSEGEIKSEKSPEITKQNFISVNSINAIRQGMRQTVTSGSARSLDALPVAVAGKTGTAQYGPNNSKKHAWFECFAPYDTPTIAMVVLLEGGGEGSTYASPVARETLKWYFGKR
jgi:penicillin-binding protein 2